MLHNEILIESRYRFGFRVKELRTRQNLTQLQLGQIVGLNRSQISRLERGEANITLDTILLIADGLGVAPSDLFVEINAPFMGPSEPVPVMLNLPRNRSIDYFVTKH